MPKSDFINELVKLGYTPFESDGNKIIIDYLVPVGKNIGINVQLGLEIPNDFPINPPPGPHFKSINLSNWIQPSQNIQSSPFGADWIYWSRPFPDWNRTKKIVRIYLSHIRNLLVKL